MQSGEKEIELDENTISELKERERRGRDKGASSYYQRFLRSQGKYTQEAEFYAVSKYLKVKPSDTVLDVGCGIGRLALEFAKRGNIVVGIDLSPKAVLVFNENMRKRNLNGEAYVGDICSFRANIGPFDKAFSMEVIQHIPSPNERTKALNCINNLLRKNGLLVLTVLNWTARARDLKYKEGFYGSGSPLDLWRVAFTESDLESMLGRSGFETLAIGGISNLPIRLRRVMPGWTYFLEFFLSHFRISMRLGAHLIAKARKM